jgi:guanylate kinase
VPAIVLYGPPAAGKDTVTKALTSLDLSYRHYQCIKIGAGRTAGYRMATLSHLDELRGSGAVVWETRRYGALYVVDRPSLAEMLNVSIPVLHSGQVEAVKAVTGAVGAQWVTVWLWCPRDVAARRIAERGTGDTAARLRVWDATEPLPDADISVNTAEVTPADAATAIHGQVQSRSSERGR